MKDSRKEWLNSLLAIVGPVLDALENGELKNRIPLQFNEKRGEFAPLEAFGRSMVGMAPWLEVESSSLCEDERQIQKNYREKAVRCIAMAVEPNSTDFMNFSVGGQPLVDTAFLAHAIVRAPKFFLEALSSEVRHQLADALKSSRMLSAYNCNWIFFSAMVEGGLYVLGEQHDNMRVLYAMRTFQGWYKGDGVYGDGEMFHWDYYNSFVIQPMFVDLVELFSKENEEIEAMRTTVISRASRYASVLERMICPEGTYPVIGRSICYRFGAFQMLSQAALQHILENDLSPASVRCAMSAMIKRVMSAPDMFDEQGWLLPGVYGHQPELAEEYINIGSLYLCSTVFLALGLPPQDLFWSGEDEKWSSKKVWSGGKNYIDHAID